MTEPASQMETTADSQKKMIAHFLLAPELESIHLTKIDIQGHELGALQGATQALARTNYVLVESAIQKLYEDALSFTQVHDFLIQHNFHIVSLRAWHRGNDVLIGNRYAF